MRTFAAVFLGSLGMAGACLITLQAQIPNAQTTNPPTVYSFTELSSLIAPDVTLKIYRNGSKELIDESRPRSGDSPQGYHLRILYDFQAHQVYAWDLIETARPCSRSEYAEAAAPYQTDVISGAAALAADIADGKPKTVGSEKVNGIDATIVELSDPSGQGTTRIWLAEKSNYVVKWVTIPKSGGPQTQLEIKNLSFTKLPPSVFVLPAGCK